MTLRIDKLSEDAILKSLERDLGSNSFVFFSEEVGEKKPDGLETPVIVCDPLDGSHNAQVGIPIFSISLSVLHSKSSSGIPLRRFGDVEVAFIQSLRTNDEFYAIKGGGAFHNRKRIQPASERENNSSPTFKTFAIECGDVQYIKRLISNLTQNDVYKLRILGSAALSLCFVADGSLDGLAFAQSAGARSIDSAGGYLIAREAGCVFSDISGEKDSIDDCEISFDSRVNLAVARSKTNVNRMLEIIRPALAG